jgi:hypothetical protein
VALNSLAGDAVEDGPSSKSAPWAALERVRGIEPIVELGRKSLIPMRILDEAGGTGEISVLPFCSNLEGPSRAGAASASVSLSLLQVQLGDARATGQKTWLSKRSNSRRPHTKTRSDANDTITGGDMPLVREAALCLAGSLRVAVGECSESERSTGATCLPRTRSTAAACLRCRLIPRASQ